MGLGMAQKPRDALPVSCPSCLALHLCSACAASILPSLIWLGQGKEQARMLTIHRDALPALGWAQAGLLGSRKAGTEGKRFQSQMWVRGGNSAISL